MNYKDFLKIAKTVCSTIDEKDNISKKWTTGGVSGGSCWNTGEDEDGNDVHYSEPGESEPVFEDLDKLLETVCPTISFLTYKKLCRECITERKWKENEYYGNHTSYAEHIINLNGLFSWLMKNNALLV